MDCFCALARKSQTIDERALFGESQNFFRTSELGTWRDCPYLQKPKPEFCKPLLERQHLCQNLRRVLGDLRTLHLARGFLKSEGFVCGGDKTA